MQRIIICKVNERECSEFFKLKRKNLLAGMWQTFDLKKKKISQIISAGILLLSHLLFLL
jgi:hypothetical protein